MNPLELPLDIFDCILSSFSNELSDMMFLWTTCREVCRDFKRAVERIFMKKYLTYTRIIIPFSVCSNVGIYVRA